MARLRKLTPAAIRDIFKSGETAKALGTRYGVSQHMIYLIRSGRAHRKLTQRMPVRKRGRGRPASGKTARAASAARGVAAQININALADALLDRFMARLLRSKS